MAMQEYTIIPKNAPPLDDEEEAEVKRIESLLYKECYRGHIPPEQWHEWALFCFYYQRAGIPAS
jgi:hypothetical protein